MLSLPKKIQNDVVRPRYSYIEHSGNRRSVNQAIRGRRFRGSATFGALPHVLPQPLIGNFANPTDRVIHFVYPTVEDATVTEAYIPTCCDYAHALQNSYLLAVGDSSGQLSFKQTDPDTNIQDIRNRIQCHPSRITDVKWRNDDAMVLTGGIDTTIKSWDTETSTELVRFEGHTGVVNSVNWHPTNQHIFTSSSDDGSFKIWDIRVDQNPVINAENIPIRNASISADSAHPFNQRRPRRQLPRPVSCALYNGQNPNQMFTSGRNDGKVKIWDIRLGRQQRTISSAIFLRGGRRKGISHMQMDHDRTRLFIACHDNQIYMHNPRDLPQRINQFSFEGLTISNFDTRISISPDNRYLLSSSNTGVLHIWTIDGPNNVTHTFNGHTARSTSVAWCRSQYYQFASCSHDGTTRIWDIDSNIPRP